MVMTSALGSGSVKKSPLAVAMRFARPAAAMCLRAMGSTTGKSKLMPGETFAMEFLPGKGTQFYIAGAPQGEPVGDAEFFSMVLKIWVGNSPADNGLKDALLGIER